MSFLDFWTRGRTQAVTFDQVSLCWGVIFDNLLSKLQTWCTHLKQYLLSNLWSCRWQHHIIKPGRYMNCVTRQPQSQTLENTSSMEILDEYIDFRGSHGVCEKMENIQFCIFWLRATLPQSPRRNSQDALSSYWKRQLRIESEYLSDVIRASRNLLSRFPGHCSLMKTGGNYLGVMLTLHWVSQMRVKQDCD